MKGHIILYLIGLSLFIFGCDPPPPPEFYLNEEDSCVELSVPDEYESLPHIFIVYETYGSCPEWDWSVPGDPFPDGPPYYTECISLPIDGGITTTICAVTLDMFFHLESNCECETFFSVFSP